MEMKKSAFRFYVLVVFFIHAGISNPVPGNDPLKQLSELEGAIQHFEDGLVEDKESHKSASAQLPVSNQLSQPAQGGKLLSNQKQTIPQQEVAQILQEDSSLQQKPPNQDLNNNQQSQPEVLSSNDKNIANQNGPVSQQNSQLSDQNKQQQPVDSAPFSQLQNPQPHAVYGQSVDQSPLPNQQQAQQPNQQQSQQPEQQQQTNQQQAQQQAQQPNQQFQPNQQQAQAVQGQDQALNQQQAPQFIPQQQPNQQESQPIIQQYAQHSVQQYAQQPNQQYAQQSVQQQPQQPQKMVSDQQQVLSQQSVPPQVPSQQGVQQQVQPQQSVQQQVQPQQSAPQQVQPQQAVSQQPASQHLSQQPADRQQIDGLYIPPRQQVQQAGIRQPPQQRVMPQQGQAQQYGNKQPRYQMPQQVPVGGNFVQRNPSQAVQAQPRGPKGSYAQMDQGPRESYIGSQQAVQPAPLVQKGIEAPAPSDKVPRVPMLPWDRRQQGVADQNLASVPEQGEGAPQPQLYDSRDPGLTSVNQPPQAQLYMSGNVEPQPQLYDAQGHNHLQPDQDVTAFSMTPYEKDFIQRLQNKVQYLKNAIQNQDIQALESNDAFLDNLSPEDKALIKGIQSKIHYLEALLFSPDETKETNEKRQEQLLKAKKDELMRILREQETFKSSNGQPGFTQEDVQVLRRMKTKLSHLKDTLKNQPEKQPETDTGDTNEEGSDDDLGSFGDSPLPSEKLGGRPVDPRCREVDCDKQHVMGQLETRLLGDLNYARENGVDVKDVIKDLQIRQETQRQQKEEEEELKLLNSLS